MIFWGYKMNNKFTLVELLVVVSIIGILVSILMPSLQGARSKSESKVCLSNLKQMGVGVVGYARDNNNKMVPAWIGDYWNCRTWDDWIGDYMGRVLSNKHKKKEWLKTSHNDSPVNKVFLCPTDKIPLPDNTSFTDGQRRTYNINYSWSKGVAWRESEVFMTQIANDTMVFSEGPHKSNVLGKEGLGFLKSPEQMYNKAPNHHGPGIFNFYMVDHSAKTLHYTANVNNGTLTDAQGMWTRAEND